MDSHDSMSERSPDIVTVDSISYKLIPLRVISYNGKMRKGVVCHSIVSLKEQCIEKFKATACDIESARIVCADDGTEIEEDVFLQTLEPHSVVMFLEEGQFWSSSHDSVSASKVNSKCSDGDVKEDNIKREEQQMVAMIEKMREKIKKRKLEPSKLGSEQLPSNSNLKFHCGWKHYSYTHNEYKQIKTTTRNLAVALKQGTNVQSKLIVVQYNSTYDDVVRVLTDLYFPKGKSVKGQLLKMECQLGTYKEVIARENFSVLDLYNKKKTAEARIYLLTKEKVQDIEITTDEDSDEDEDIMSSIQSPYIVQQDNQLRTPTSNNFNSTAGYSCNQFFIPVHYHL